MLTACPPAPPLLLPLLRRKSLPGPFSPCGMPAGAPPGGPHASQGTHENHVAAALVGTDSIKLAPIEGTSRSTLSQGLFPNVLGAAVLPAQTCNLSVVRRRSEAEHDGELATSHGLQLGAAARDNVAPREWDWRVQRWLLRTRRLRESSFPSRLTKGNN